MPVEIFDRAGLDKSLEDPSRWIFRSAVEFSEFVESIANQREELIMNVLIEFCELYDLEYENLSKMLTVHLKDKVASEMQDAGLLPKQNRIEFED
jgi:hypothetical protein